MPRQRASGKIQRNNYHHGSRGPYLTSKMMSVFLIFTQGTQRNVRNRRVRNSLKGYFSLNDSMRGQRATGKIQRNNCHLKIAAFFNGKTISVFLIFTQGTNRNVNNR